MMRKDALGPPPGSEAHRDRWTSTPAVVIYDLTGTSAEAKPNGDKHERSTFMPLSALPHPLYLPKWEADLPTPCNTPWRPRASKRGRALMQVIACSRCCSPSAGAPLQQ